MQKIIPASLMILFLVLIGGAFCQQEPTESSMVQSNIKLELVKHLDDVFLNVSFSNIFNKLVYQEASLVCFQNNNQSMERAKRIPHRRLTKKRTFRTESYKYKLVLQTEGYVQCVYKPWGRTLATSNLVFVRFGNIHVSVVKLNQNVTPQVLQETLDTKQFLVRQISSDKSVFHLNGKFYSKSPDSDGAILKYLKELLWTKIKPPLVVEYVRSTRFCPPLDEYQVPYTNFGGNYSFGQGFVLQCVGNFYTGAIWDEEQLEKLFGSKISKPEYVFQTENASFADLNDIKSFSDKLRSATALNERELPIIATKFDQLVIDEKSLLRAAKANQNTSNELLANLEMALVNTTLVSGFAQEVRPNFAARVEDLKETGTTGILIMDNKTDVVDSDQSEQQMVPLTAMSSNEQVVESSPSVGMRLPNSLLEAWDTPQRLVVTVFRDAKSLFGEKFLTSSIVSATLGGVHYQNLQEPVVLWFRRNATISPNPGICVYWDFEGAQARGKWSTEGCYTNTTHQLSDTIFLDECHCFHMTHFGEILWNSDTPFFDANTDDEYTLELISQIGCIVSLIALCGVFLTALIHRHWLKGPGQKILLQMSINLALLLIMFLVAANVKTNRVGCFFVGFILHYAVLSNLFFMAVAGYLQYHRLVRVIYTRTPKLILKSAVIGWGVPVVPGALVLIAGRYDLYSQKPLCLPRGWVFYVAILVPLCVILVLNIVIFVKIARNLYMMVEPRRHIDRCLSVRRFKQLAFLFTLLGLNWIFGVCQVVFPENRVLFAYLFSGTVAFQGLAYFVFFVLMHDKARHSWKAFLCGGKMLFKIEWNSVGKEMAQSQTESTSCQPKH